MNLRHPLFFCAAVFSAGIIAAGLIDFSFEAAYLLCAGFLILSLIFFRGRAVFILYLSSAVFFFGACYLINSRVLPKCQIIRQINYGGGKFFCIKGKVISQPALNQNKTSFFFQVREIQSKNKKLRCCGNILVYLKGKVNLAYGDLLLLKGNLFRPYSFGNRQQSFRDYLRNQGVLVLLRVRSASEVIILERNKGFPLKQFSLRLKNKIEKIIFRHTSGLTAAVLDAMVLGEKKFIPPFIYQSMMKSGTVHILVVSGFNTGLVAFILLLGLKLLRLKRKIRFMLAIPCLLIYCFATGATNPVVRATIMSMVLLAGYLVKREPDIYNALGLAALFILLLNPRQVFEIGFQLSFASVLAIVYLYPRLSNFFQVQKIKIRPLKLLFEGGLVSFSAWIGTSALIAYHFRMFSPVTVLANILIVPLATLITLCGFSLIGISLISPAFALPFSAACSLAVSLLIRINLLLLKFPWAYFSFN